MTFFSICADLFQSLFTLINVCHFARRIHQTWSIDIENTKINEYTINQYVSQHFGTSPRRISCWKDWAGSAWNDPLNGHWAECSVLACLSQLGWKDSGCVKIFWTTAIDSHRFTVRLLSKTSTRSPMSQLGEMQDWHRAVGEIQYTWKQKSGILCNFVTRQT